MLKKGGKSIGGRQKSEQHSQTKAIHGIKAISLCWADYGRGELCGTNQYCHVTSDPSQWLDSAFDPLRNAKAIPSLPHGMLGGMGLAQYHHFKNVEKCDCLKHFCTYHRKTKDEHPIYALHGTSKDSERNCVERCRKFIVQFMNSNMDIQAAKPISKM